ncbi:DUF1818 family protein [Prochlorococcus sp. MIT 1223]|uniref:DUF1818 family protein n=1 Tax=Prochlorococcus sp. MIT 1223 TaxID=3096217 RepID=UPI002A75155F|nr:DUF1818 family protein [Prochlorococcus sp. MIT 1223]
MIRNEGIGWRLAIDDSRKDFVVLLGGDNWASELTKEEWNSLVPLVLELVNQHETYKDKLVSDESISFELERSPWWACLDGNKRFWSLKLILSSEQLSSSRGLEMYWPIPTAQAFVLAMRSMWDSSQ